MQEETVQKCARARARPCSYQVHSNQTLSFVVMGTRKWDLSLLTSSLSLLQCKCQTVIFLSEADG